MLALYQVQDSSTHTAHHCPVLTVTGLTSSLIFQIDTQIVKNIEHGSTMD